MKKIEALCHGCKQIIRHYGDGTTRVVKEVQGNGFLLDYPNDRDTKTTWVYFCAGCSRTNISVFNKG